METASQISGDAPGLPLRGPAGEILRLLQRHGPLNIKQLRELLGVRSLNAVREQILSLTAEGLIQATPVRQPAGRPAYVYALSDKAQALFPKGYDVLLKLVLEELVAQEGRERLQMLLGRVSARLAEEYGGQGEGQALHQRLAVLAQAFDERGTPITIIESAEAIELHGYSCPYFNVAQENGDVCAVEQRMVEQVLGRKVKLARRMVDGHVGCRFVVDGAGQPLRAAATEGEDAASSDN